MSIPNSSAVLGFSNDRATPAGAANQEHILGTVVVAGDTDYTYALAAAAIAAAGTVALTGAYGATTTTAGATYTHDVAAPGVPINGYFWAKKVTTPF